ncbi:MAG TPA: TIGR03936 family radical SAM-associated protein [Chloroflexota bacterium]|nr:TIGR03936 family radical SAM-associated protein [Chloroflexota bacterium]HUM71108.1 TIGR03936 family radical SAM-associated protein [Chloroflexota bacterium]
MQADYVQRLRMTFGKGGPARYISHLDLARALERALNRASLPVAYTHGFNRRPRLQMATALPLGYTSAYELADVLMMERVEPEAARQQLMARMAPGIEVFHMADVPLQAPSLQASTVESTYVATPLDPVDRQELAGRIAELLAAPQLLREREQKGKLKSYDLRPLLLDLCLLDTADSLPQIQMRLLLQPSLTGRPDEVMLALGLDPLAARIHRTRIVLQDE